jgi:hypothetical protein
MSQIDEEGDNSAIVRHLEMQQRELISQVEDLQTQLQAVQGVCARVCVRVCAGHEPVGLTPRPACNLVVVRRMF